MASRHRERENLEKSFAMRDRVILQALCCCCLLLINMRRGFSSSLSRFHVELYSSARLKIKWPGFK